MLPHEMRLGAADVTKPTLSTQLIAKRRVCKGASQSTFEGMHRSFT
jgi:hypothetical protein